MSKHPFLPKEYSDSATQTAILFALSPYKILDRSDIVNPNLKWDLLKAWQDAEILLKKRVWKRRDNEDASEISYELAADTDTDIDELNCIIAGIVAYQILEPDSGLAIGRIAHRKGGEMVMIISAYVADKLKELIPESFAQNDPEKINKPWWNILSWIKIGNKR